MLCIALDGYFFDQICASVRILHHYTLVLRRLEKRIGKKYIIGIWEVVIYVHVCTCVLLVGSFPFLFHFPSHCVFPALFPSLSSFLPHLKKTLPVP